MFVVFRRDVFDHVFVWISVSKKLLKHKNDQFYSQHDNRETYF